MIPKASCGRLMIELVFNKKNRVLLTLLENSDELAIALYPDDASGEIYTTDPLEVAISQRVTVACHYR